MELTLDPNRRYTYADYLTWLDDKRRELWHGIVQLMTPAPNTAHQKVTGRLHGFIFNFLRKNNSKFPCEIFTAPFDVRFPEKGETDPQKIKTVVQPDLVIVCDKSKIDEHGCLGAPDLIVEVVSPRQGWRDAKQKFKLYEEYGVPEYWIVYPYEHTVHVFLLKDGKYQLEGIYTDRDKIPMRLFGGEFELDLAEVFEDV